MFAICHDIIFTENNARADRTRETNKYLETAAINCTDWPASSWSLSAIEHDWDMPEVAIETKPNQTTTTKLLRSELEVECARLPYVYCMRCQKVIDERCHS